MIRPVLRPKRIRRGLRHLPMVAWLWLLWVLLWGSAGALVMIGGLLVAVAVVLAFPLPAVLPGAVPRPVPAARLLLHLLTDLVRSGVIVARQVLRHGGRTTAAVIEIPLHADSDLMVTAVAELTSVSSGTLVVEIDRRRSRLYVHALPMADGQDITRRREEVQALERRIAEVLGRRLGSDDGSGPDGPDGPDEPDGRDGPEGRKP
ncbi:Na+/H+ antiporter subunit E [Streptomyces sp. CRN 30]|uniref:Na+/H+ antiporter subunit E n=1 Tax=Streptomyces sp. CRN 30 TaxID=3075613 RepID=UPI002A7FA142|nr:Na+/H+ antiporter subunit E [Streptomyces sp. CRN 30]